MVDECRWYDVDGEPVRVHGGRPLSAEGRAALSDIVRAAQLRMERTDPHLAVRQELVQAALAAARCIPNGPLEGRFGPEDGTAVKARLRAAVAAARAVLGPQAPDVKEEPHEP